MTIEELKEKKQALEKEIAEKIQEFEREAGVEVSDISLNRKYLNFESFHVIEPVETNIEVKL